MGRPTGAITPVTASIGLGAVDVGVLLGSGVRCLVPHWSWQPGAVDDQNHKIVGVAVEEFVHAAGWWRSEQWMKP